jgi:hypothetical protein
LIWLTTGLFACSLFKDLLKELMLFLRSRHHRDAPFTGNVTQRPTQTANTTGRS